MTTAARGARAASPDQSSEAARAAAVSVPTFLPPAPQRQDFADPSRTQVHPQTRTEETRGEHPSEADSFADDGSDDPVSLAVGQSPESTGKGLGLKPLVTASQVKATGTLVEAMLMGATTLFNKRTRTHPQDDRWLMSRKEREAIAAPFARILARRSPVPTGGEDASDIADGIEGVVGIIAYVLGQAMAERPETVTAAAVLNEHQDDEPPAAAGPGAVASPFDPAYRAY